MKEMKDIERRIHLTSTRDAMRVLKETSRTFYIPITFLQRDLKKAVASAYLCMRAIDEIEDHEEIPKELKADILMKTAALLEGPFDDVAYQQVLQPILPLMPEVTRRLGDWIDYCPAGARMRMQLATAEMAEGMAKWALKEWKVETHEDLDDYTYYVAGLVGVMLSDLWEWDSGIRTDRDLAIGYGRGLQAVNILRNQEEDSERGVGYFPKEWTQADMFSYAEGNLAKADAYMEDISKRSIRLFCQLPLTFAHKTLDAMKSGREKMTRAEVERTVQEVAGDDWEENA